MEIFNFWSIACFLAFSLSRFHALCLAFGVRLKNELRVEASEQASKPMGKKAKDSANRGPLSLARPDQTILDPQIDPQSCVPVPISYS